MDKQFLVLALWCLTIQSISATNIICYHGTWSYNRTGDGQFNISDVPANLCTHYIYAFVGLDVATFTIQLLDESFDIGQNGLADAVALKEVNPDLKVLVAVGGYSQGSANYSTMAADADSRSTFIQSAYEFATNYSFDGFDIDWEYPGRRDNTSTEDKENFASLLEEWYAVFNPAGLILTAAVSAIPSTLDISYDVPVLSEYLDSINIMTYDIHGSWDGFTGFNSPLYMAASENGTDYEDYNINASINGWIERGADPAKLALGIPFYGHTYILANDSDTEPGATTTGAGDAGPYTAESGVLSYLEIIEEFNDGGWTTVWDSEQAVPYAYKNSTWLSYDNVKSIKQKVQYALDYGLGGIMLWAVDLDDIVAASGTKFPLLKAINNALNQTEYDGDGYDSNEFDSEDNSF